MRGDRINALYLRLNKIIAFPESPARADGHNVVNALQSKTPAGIGTGNATFITLNYFSDTYAVPNSWVQPGSCIGTRHVLKKTAGLRVGMPTRSWRSRRPW